ncbi:MAG TPA: HmuY family protein [Edaphocola sp.]|nr:HmuY family protein [Edaphocola sp.]
MKNIIATLSVLFLLQSCAKSKLENIDIPKSSGNVMVLNGINGSEIGSNAANMVFVDLSKDAQSTLKRADWDLKFYCGSDFRVLINNTTAAMAKVTNKYDLSAVSASDVQGFVWTVDIANPSPITFTKVDDLYGDLTKTIIPEVSAMETENPVIVLGRGEGGAIPKRDLIKLKLKKIFENAYEIKWSKLDENNIHTDTIFKDEQYNFMYFSFDSGVLEKAAPQKPNWDFVWSVSIFHTPYYDEEVAYVFSDMVAINNRAGVRVAEKKYANEHDANNAFENYSLGQVQEEQFSDSLWAIGNKWRSTPAPGESNIPGVKKDRFYILQDPQGNYYKLKFLSFSLEDGGERGRPDIKYILLQ